MKEKVYAVFTMLGGEKAMVGIFTEEKLAEEYIETVKENKSLDLNFEIVEFKLNKGW